MTFLEQFLLTIVTALVTAIVTYFGFWRQAKADLEKEYKFRFNEKKWEVYYSFIGLLPTIIELNKLIQISTRAELNEARLKRAFELTDIYNETIPKIRNQILLIGSLEVVKYFLEWTSQTSIIHAEQEFAVEKLVKVINTMREDLGERKSNINYKDLEGIYFFSDKWENVTTPIDQYLRQNSE